MIIPFFVLFSFGEKKSYLAPRFLSDFDLGFQISIIRFLGFCSGFK
jgi:hypothetical protein